MAEDISFLEVLFNTPEFDQKLRKLVSILLRDANEKVTLLYTNK